MKWVHSYLNNAVQILNKYEGDKPFPFFLKDFFSQDKKYGSKDRKQISHLCYCYFRLGKLALHSRTKEGMEERILIGLFLCSVEPNEILEKLKPQWNDEVTKPVKEKFSTLNIQQPIYNVFPWKNELSEEINYEKFCESFFIQPDLFLRLRPGYENKVKEKLTANGINFIEKEASCIALSNSSKTESIVELDKEAVIQDYSSQRTGDVFKMAVHRLSPVFDAWDCCAASGGKSLLLHDINPNIHFTVSDVRESILVNLKKRFAKCGIKNYKSFVIDLTNSSQRSIINNQYPLVICDAPCTGSGTWSRTPEQLFFFDEDLPAGQVGKIEQYSSLQKKIVANIISHLKKEGFLIYITCSVFKKENEEVVEYMKETIGLTLLEQRLLTGYDKKADTLFIALLQKKL